MEFSGDFDVTPQALQTLESGYYLIAELITMPDRVLAQKVELDIWLDSPHPHPARLVKYLEASRDSEDGADLMQRFRELVHTNKLVYSVHNLTTLSRDGITYTLGNVTVNSRPSKEDHI